ncbi:hypothetical protein RI129_002822 [Pyrocoelia pectoralis]|uniref:CCHC-type domain-containing protein n=1 Tax=Pyrocoelia pectoralis TaxID=417401 RepID=A0AAN7ZI72_9COLE
MSLNEAVAFDEAPVSPIGNWCKKCKKKVAVANIKCLKCDSVYHRSCAQVLENKDKNFIMISDTKLICPLHRGDSEIKDGVIIKSSEEDVELICKLKTENEQLVNVVINLKAELNKLKMKINESQSHAKGDNVISYVNKNDLLLILNDFKEDIYTKLEAVRQEVKLNNNHLDNNLLEENKCLKGEIASIKCQTSINDQLKSYSSAVKGGSKVLIVNQKGPPKDVQQIKQDLRTKVNPTEIGVGLTMGKSTKKGGLILNCGAGKDIKKLQVEIQHQLGDSYNVDRPKVLEHRLKIVGINECEFMNSDEVIVSKIIKQNNINEHVNSKLKVIHKSKIVKQKFNLIFEVDINTYNAIMEHGKLNIGWNRCSVFDDFGIIRCFKCCRYGHLARDCNNNRVCFKCGCDHDANACQSEVVKCLNCVSSNEKYGLNLDVNHLIWNIQTCETYKRIEKVQRNKYIK